MLTHESAERLLRAGATVHPVVVIGVDALGVEGVHALEFGGPGGSFGLHAADEGVAGVVGASAGGFALAFAFGVVEAAGDGAVVAVDGFEFLEDDGFVHGGAVAEGGGWLVLAREEEEGSADG